MSQAFNLSQFANKVNTSGQADLTTAVTGTLPQGNGGTGLTTPGTSGNVLMSDGTNWVSGTIYATRNRIINGAMTIDQRNAGASLTPTFDGQYTLDRFQVYISQSSKFSVQQNAGSVTPPAGFNYYAGITSLSAYTVGSSDYFCFVQNIEGYNIGDFAWGTASAKTITISFWVRSSLTGTFGGSIRNGAANYSYPFTYSISSANTWEQKTVTIAGPTSGTWTTVNTSGLQLILGLGVGSTNSGTAGAWTGSSVLSATSVTSVVGTNGATFYITGVQLEQGSTATPFERRLYNQELANCQRYFEKSYDASVVPGANSTNGGISMASSNFTNTSYFNSGPLFKVTKRTSPTMVVYSPGGTQGKVWNTSDVDTGAGILAANIGDNGPRYFVATVTAVGALGIFSFQFTASAEL
jgi:hypothetical protein